MILPKINLPGTKLNVSRLCLGVPLWGTTFREPAMDELFNMFLEAGGNFFDTAHCYAFWLPNGNGSSEKALGRMIHKYAQREDVVIGTKGGHPSGGALYPRPDYYMCPEMIAKDIADSLARLQMEKIDVYYLHRDDTRMPVSEIMECLNEHVRVGHIRYLGASNWSIARIAEANVYAADHGIQGFVVSQPQWSLAHPSAPVPTSDPCMRHITQNDVQWHTKYQFPVVSYSSNAGGYFDSEEPPKGPYDNAVSRARHARAKCLAEDLDAKPGQIALAYLLSQPFPVIPAIGTTNVDRLRDAISAASLSLAPELLRYLEVEVII